MDSSCQAEAFHLPDAEEALGHAALEVLQRVWFLAGEGLIDGLERRFADALHLGELAAVEQLAQIARGIAHRPRRRRPGACARVAEELGGERDPVERVDDGAARGHGVGVARSGTARRSRRASLR